MRVQRVLALAAFAAAATIATSQPAVASHDCDKNPNYHCYECVRYPCYPEDYPPYLLDLIFGDGS